MRIMSTNFARTLFGNMNMTSQTAHTKYKWPPYATEWNPPRNFSAYATDL